jgi:hypothetical protein
MMYLCAIFASPLYFLIRGKWGGFFINSIFYGLAWLFLLTFVFAIVAPLFWIVAFTHASWSIRKEMAEEHAEMLATKMATKMRGQ